MVSSENRINIKNLCAVREAKKLSQAQAARALGISRQRLCQWEKGRKAISVNNLAMLADFYAVKFDVFITEPLPVSATN